MDLMEAGYTANYAQMSVTQLMAVARAYDTLVEPAQTALRAEFTRRHLEPPLVDEDREEMQQRCLVTVRRFRDLSEAIVVRGFLQSHGIEVFLQDENLVRLDWQVSNFIGGLRLQVEAADEAQALALLEEPIPNPVPYDHEGGPELFDQPHCPVCGSIDIDFQGQSRKAALASLYLAALPLPRGAETWLCNRCGARWEDTDAA